jgi:rhodanese-related sulfurtransferase
MRHHMLILRALIVLLAMIGTQTFAADAEYPGRKIYVDTPYITLKQLTQEFNDAIVVDVRSGYEYSTLHIKNAFNIPLNSKTFIQQMNGLRKQQPQKKIVTYRNGKTCMKSYKAASKCRTNGIDNVVVFDAGIMDWAKANPNLAVLLGTSPIDPARLISKDKFSARLLDPETFFKQANNSNPFIIDVRDPLQRAGMPLFVGREKRAALDDTNKLKVLIAQAKKERRPLYIYDEAGKQVRWLMYYLEDQGATDYFFMKGGAKAYFKGMSTDFTQSKG